MNSVNIFDKETAKAIGLIYRGDLKSCNFRCAYCPFSKKPPLKSALDSDSHSLTRFIDWIADQTEYRIHLLIAPLGEALIHPYYRNALIRLYSLPNIDSVSIQTNLSLSPQDLAHIFHPKLGLWITYHPDQSNFDHFLKKIHLLTAHNIDFSIGLVALPEYIPIINQFRENMQKSHHIWFNARMHPKYQYTPEQISFFSEIDPYFLWNLEGFTNNSRKCFAGSKSFLIDATGDVSRCILVRKKLGNIYRNKLRDLAIDIPCEHENCDCYLSYCNLDDEKMNSAFGILPCKTRFFRSSVIN